MAKPKDISPVKRLQVIYVLVTIIFAVFIARAFYMQVIRHDYYQKRAMASQLKQYEVPSERGTIKVKDGDSTVSLVLNQKLYTVYADPVLVKNPKDAAAKLATDLSLKPADVYKEITQKDTRYSVLAKKASAAVQAKVLKHKFSGIGAQEQSYRIYPQGSMASQLLGFVDDSGQGQYGIEQAMNKQLSGTAGMLKAVTDIKGVPLAANKNNISIAPKPGDDVVLTLDMGMQKQMENILKDRTKKTKMPLVSAVIMEINTGAVKAMANYPTYNPAKLDSVADPNVFNNASVSHPIEVGSIMKALTVAAALDDGVVKPGTKYYDPSHFIVDGFKIKNVEEDGGPHEQSLYTLLNLSLNTGATWLLMQMGGGHINQQARDTWHDYLTNHFMLGKKTGIEQGYESPGFIPSPQKNDAAINLTYANTAFGQAMTATPIQMAAALSAVMNGGTYYQPRLVSSTVDQGGKVTAVKPKVVDDNIVKPSIATNLAKMLEYSVENHGFVPRFDENRYMVGGKTGTAQLALPGGGYSKTEFNGSYMGFVGGSKPQYAICVFTIKPQVNYYAGTAAAQPIFGELAHMLINNSYVSPKS